VADISYIVVNGVRYPVVDGTTVNIEGVVYTIEELLAIAQQPTSNNTEEPQQEQPSEPDNGTYPDVSYIVLNGEKYSIDDEQATTDLQRLQESIAYPYSDTSTYSVGDYCIYGGYLYECIVGIENPEPFSEEHWQRTVVTETRGVSNYNQLENKPSINNVTLQNNTTLQQLGLQGIYYDTKDGWNAQSTLVAEQGAIYIYKDYSVSSDGKDVPALKIGDGTSYLIDMPIVNGDVADMLLEHINNAVIHVTADDKTFWNNKSSAYLDQSTTETLVLSNTNFMLRGIIYNHG
jgi:hypothetical protein